MFQEINAMKSTIHEDRLTTYKILSRKYLLLMFCLPMFWACDDSNFNNRNPNIPNYSFSEQINLSLPGYSRLTYPSNGIYYPGGSLNGIIIFNTGSGYLAFDAACPNQPLASCSTMTVSGINAICGCDDAEYSLFTGQSPGKEYPMKQYRVEVNGSMLRVYN